MTGPLGIGVMGCADIARRRMLPAIARTAGVRLVAVASRDAERARRTAAEARCRAVHGYEALLADEAVEAVYLPLPAALHATWAEAALRAGRHVLAEKPLATDRAGTARLLGLARERGLVLRENVMFVHHSQHGTVQKLIADGAIGEPRSLRAAFTVPRRAPEDIRYRPELGGGALWDTGVYPVRAALHLLGPDLEVAGAVSARAPGFAVDTAGTALLRGPGGLAAQLEFGLDHAYQSRYEVCGERGRIVVERAFTPPATHRPALRLQRNGDGGPAGVPPDRTIQLPPDDQVAGAVAEFASAVRTGAPPDPLLLRQAELLDGIRRAAGLGGGA